MAQGELTARQQEVFDFLDRRQRQTGFVPSLQETAQHFGFKSANSVRQHLRLIEKKGFLQRIRGRSRAVIIVRQNGFTEGDLVRVPLLGHISAGDPAIAQQDPEAVLALPAHLFRGNRLFAVRVRGTSMKDAGIFDGDIAVLDGIAEVKNGTIAAVLIGGDATLKRLYRKRRSILLKAENRAFRDIEIKDDGTSARVLGSLVGIIRKI